MKCIVLTENTTCREDLQCEHGLSLWIETDQHTILFDAGQSDAFYHNALRLSLDLNQVDICILSHGHYDHAGGLKKFLEVNHHARIYMHEKAHESHWHGQDKYIGINADLIQHPRVVLVNNEVILEHSLRLIPCIQYQPIVPIQSYGLLTKTKHGFEEDCFEHELVLQINENKKILFSGCTHSGIQNVMHWFSPDVLIGGFHLKKVDPVKQKDELIELAGILKSYPTVYYTGHCTGEKQVDTMKKILNDRLNVFSTGDVLTIE